MSNLNSKVNSLRLKQLVSRLNAITYKGPNFGAATGEVISGSLGRGEGGRFANIEDIRRASQSNNPLEVFQGSKKRMLQTFQNEFTRESPFTKDLIASQKKVADLLAAKNGNWDDEVRQAQQASDELWQLDTAYRRSGLTGDTGLKPSGLTVKIEGFNSAKTGDGPTVAEMIQSATGEPAESYANGIGQRMVQDAYNYLSMFNQRDELKALNGDKPEFNLTRLPDGQKYKINEEELAKGKIKIDFNYDPNNPQGPTKDDITAAMSDIMMKLDPEIVKYAETFLQKNPNFELGGDKMPKDLLQQAMASMLNDPLKMAQENPDLFAFVASASQGIDLNDIPPPVENKKPSTQSNPYAEEIARSQEGQRTVEQGGKIQSSTQSNPYAEEIARSQQGQRTVEQGGKVQFSGPYDSEIARSQEGQRTVEQGGETRPSTQSNPYASEIARSQQGQQSTAQGGRITQPSPYDSEIARSQEGQRTTYQGGFNNPNPTQSNPYESEIARSQQGQQFYTAGGRITSTNPYANEMARSQQGQQSTAQGGQYIPDNRARQYEPVDSTQSNPYANEMTRGQQGQQSTAQGGQYIPDNRARQYEPVDSTQSNPYANEMTRGQEGQRTAYPQNRAAQYEPLNSTRSNPYTNEMNRGQQGQRTSQQGGRITPTNPYASEIARGQEGQRTAYPQNRAAQYEPLNSTRSNPYTNEMNRGQQGQRTSQQGGRNVPYEQQSDELSNNTLTTRANNIVSKIPQGQRQFLMRDIMSNPSYAAQKYGISENDAYALAGYYRKNR